MQRSCKQGGNFASFARYFDQFSDAVKEVPNEAICREQGLKPWSFYTQ